MYCYFLPHGVQSFRVYNYECMNKKNSIIIGIAIVLAGGAWVTSSFVLTPAQTPVVSETASTAPEELETEDDVVATTTQAVATSSVPVAPAKKAPARVMIDKTLFNYDIIAGKTSCGDPIGTVSVTSDDPSKELYWGMTGAMPIWLTFSEVEGKTPGKIDMTFNCVMSGAEEDINWEFIVVEKTKEGKFVDGYYRAFKIIGDIN